MFQWRKRGLAALVSGAFILAGLGLFLHLRPASHPPHIPRSADTLPVKIPDADFWQMIEDFSEPNGFFRSENLLSNEAGLQDVIPELKKRVSPGGVYLGVGPEQNFTYILALAPKLSFIVDIRRMNLVEHLMYKALFELSSDRKEFLSRLFARPQPDGIDSKASIDDLFEAFANVEPQSTLFEQSFNDALNHLTGTHHFLLSEEDRVQLRYVLGRFFQEGPGLSYTFVGSYYQGRLGMPTYEELMLATDSEGRNWGFLATEEQFRAIKNIEERNLIIPLVGDFAGPKALRSVAWYLKQHSAVVSTFYTSNVEMYLFQQRDDWERFYANVATLPTDDGSTFIRFAAARRGQIDRLTGSLNRRTQLWSPMYEVVQAAANGNLSDYGSLLDMSN